MTLSTEQCIEVAEMWGWKRKNFDAGYISTKVDEEWWVDERGKRKFIAGGPRLKQEVNSWQGFGRTLEAMADKLNIVSIHEYRKFVKSVISAITESVWSRPFHFKHFIEATHLAALEAINNE